MPLPDHTAHSKDAIPQVTNPVLQLLAWPAPRGTVDIHTPSWGRDRQGTFRRRDGSPAGLTVGIAFWDALPLDFPPRDAFGL